MVFEARKGTMSVWQEANKARTRFQEAWERDSLRMDMVDAYGSCCQSCGEDDWMVLQLDHINDDPWPEIAAAGSSARGGYNLYEKLRQQGWPKERLQLLCANCNMRKEHKRRRAAMVAKYGEPPVEFDELTRKEQRAKAGPNSNNTSGFKGVLWDNGRSRWLARIVVDGKIQFIGRFTDIREAAKAYRAKVRELYGDLAKLPTDMEIEQIAETRVVRAKANSAEDLGL